MQDSDLPQNSLHQKPQSWSPQFIITNPPGDSDSVTHYEESQSSSYRAHVPNRKIPAEREGGKQGRKEEKASHLPADQSLLRGFLEVPSNYFYFTFSSFSHPQLQDSLGYVAFQPGRIACYDVLRPSGVGQNMERRMDIG